MGVVNEAIPFYEPADRITGSCEVAVVGKRFVDISDPIQSGPGLSNTAEGGNLVISPATAAGQALGVASHDAGVGKKVTVLRGGMVVPVTAAAAITAGAEVEVGANGKAATKASGVAVGRALTTASAADVDAMILLYH